ncbi:MAG: LytTR family DNA-binding domain-containing protein [Aerococcus suis]|nr:LytTR family DNA-binding domain-containing protein [Aerococcus suis]
MLPYELLTKIDAQLKQTQISVVAPNQLALEQVVNLIESNVHQQKLVIKNGAHVELVPLNDVIYAEVYHGVLTIETLTSSYQMKGTLAHLLEQLPSSDYLQVSKSSVVKIAAIKCLEVAFSGNFYAILKNNQKIVVSRRFVKQLKTRLGV